MEKALPAYLDALPDPCFAVDRDGKVVFWNSAMEKLTGAHSRELLGKGNFEHGFRVYGKRRPMLIDAVLDPGQIRPSLYLSFSSDGERLEADFLRVLEDGSYRRSRGVAVPVRGADGGILGALEVIKDHTEFHALSEKMDRIILETLESQKEIISTIGDLVERRSRETGRHVQRVAEYAYLLARSAGMSEEEANVVRLAAPLHDVGKIGIPDSLLNKPGALTEEETLIMREHTVMGYEIFKRSQLPVIKMAAVIALSHHERWDGSGYPEGLAGESIPLAARITTIADVFDALTHERAYKAAWTFKEARDYLRENAGTRFDPNLVTHFLDLDHEITHIHRNN